MKHFIGGGSLGMFIGLYWIPVGENKPIQVFGTAFFLALAAWGLLP